ncbi:TspO and MBR related proteins [Natronoarchaeum philippinense]|uniref:TspO and MBR related proteins n=1 Tax=Natronoarchaeum philippinense TaxID=558529 RepID=A0A285P2M5_NATPI|nr:TspO/MBR family protein [Natronoarchaeum philippinense]SNZ15698.1 TspO and MBR related proteins [Natronoarchaeum philippinense]
MSHTEQTGRFGLSDLDARNLLALAGFIVGVNAVGAAPSVVAGADTSWIEEPWFFPPTIAFPIVWTLLFTLMGVALFLVWRRGTDRRAVKIALGAFGVQMALNVAWTPAFFGLQMPGLGLAIIAALWVAIVGTIAAFDRVDRRAAALLVPYLAWVTFAAVLNYAVWQGSA